MEIAGPGYLSQEAWLGVWFAMAPSCVVATLGLAASSWPAALLSVPGFAGSFVAANPRLTGRQRLLLVASAFSFGVSMMIILVMAASELAR